MTYWSAALGPYVWHEFDPVRTAADLSAIARHGHTMVRTHLLWDAFMPTPRRVEPARLRDFERFLDIASGESLSVVPVLFAQSLGGCVFLPAHAIDVRARTRGVRVITDAVVQPGGPRDIYTDPVMLDTAATWLETMLDGFHGHPAIAAWDLGHDPATTVRPRRIDHLRAWLAPLAQRVRDSGERSLLTIGARDVTSGRAVRPAVVAASVDGLGLALDNDDVARIDPSSEYDPAVAGFVAQLTMSLAGEVPLTVHLGVMHDTDASVGHARRFMSGAVDTLVDTGCAAVYAAAWSDPGPRASEVPPFDADSRLRSRGVVDAQGAPTACGEVWIEQMREQRERRAPAPWPEALDVEAFYANLPDSLHDLLGVAPRSR